MNFQAAAIAMMAACGVASAQDSLTLYGIVDTGIEYYNNANAARDSVIREPSLTSSIPSRIGLKGTEDLGGGLGAVFVLEAGVLVDSGSSGQGNRLFGRQAYVGLNGPIGTVMAGRQNTMTIHALSDSDVFGPHTHGLSTFDSYFPNARSDNTIGYLGSFSGVTVGAIYSLGRDVSAAGGAAGTNCPGEVPGNAKACRQWSALLKYDGSEFGVATGYDIMYGNAGAGGGLTRSDYSDERILLTGYRKFGASKLGLGVVRRTTSTASERKSDLYYVGISHPLATQVVLTARIARYDVKRSADDAVSGVLQLTYLFSKRTSVYASLAHVKNEGASAIAVSSGGSVGAGLDQTGLLLGIRHNF
jgi:predicted porin